MSCKRTARRPPRRLRLTIASLAFGGDAVGRDEGGRVTFVPGAAPGDEVEVELGEEHKGWARAALVRVARPGAARIEPPCSLYRAEPGCGGCQWQHVALEAQRAAKLDIVRRALRRAGDVVRPLATPSPALGWRRRARLRFRGGVLGYAARRSHLLVDVDVCPQLEPALAGALAAVRARLLPALGGSGEVHLLASTRGEVHVVVEGGALGAGVAAAERLVGDGGIVGVRAGERVVGAAAIDLGDDAAAPFWARADVFAQASAPGNAALRAYVAEAGEGALGGARVLELHAGSGNFTRDLAAAAARVTAVEEAPAAVELARQNLAARGLADRVEAVPLPVAGALARLGGGAATDLVVVDPPRTGLGPGEAAALAALAARRAIYVSCDPETLARDLDAFLAAGWRVAWAQPVDLMPQTFHVETVVRLERAA